MTDDPHDASWIPHEKNVTWCSICQDDAETCRCGRTNAPGSTTIALLVFVITLIAAGIIAYII